MMLKALIVVMAFTQPVFSTENSCLADKGSKCSKNPCFTPDICNDPVIEGGNECGLAGVWTNELKSIMKITCSKGEITGQYCSAVGKAASYYPLAGRYLLADEGSVILGWTVSWKNKAFGNSKSATSWSGISYGNSNLINTQWLLTSYNEELWMTTQINHDEFTKKC